ncbi:MAG: hypothetical protein F4059_05895 [Gemmatimonadetes bacterium]|nr:hypothetical protein [Gemmatimonadota bacterium]
MNIETRKYFIAVIWSIVKVAAVTAILGGSLMVAAYYSPLELSGPKVAIAGIVFGLMGGALWYGRYFPALREQGRQSAKVAGKTALALAIGLFVNLQHVHAYATTSSTDSATEEVGPPTVERVELAYCVTADGITTIALSADAVVQDGDECGLWEGIGLTLVCLACSFGVAFCPGLIYMSVASTTLTAGAAALALAASLLECLGSLVACWQCVDMAMECGDEARAARAQQNAGVITETIPFIEEAIQNACMEIPEGEERPDICDVYGPW